MQFRVPEGAIELLDSSTRDSVGDLIKARGLVDDNNPRGEERTNFFRGGDSSVPVIETGAGNGALY